MSIKIFKQRLEKINIGVLVAKCQCSQKRRVSEIVYTVGRDIKKEGLNNYSKKKC